MLGQNAVNIKKRMKSNLKTLISCVFAFVNLTNSMIFLLMSQPLSFKLLYKSYYAWENYGGLLL